MTIQSIKSQIVPPLRRSGATKIAIFGSFATGAVKKNSDIDIVARFSRGMTLFGLTGLRLKLEDKTGRKVDLLTYDGINPRLRKIILKEQKIIYEKRS